MDGTTDNCQVAIRHDDTYYTRAPSRDEISSNYLAWCFCFGPQLPVDVFQLKTRFNHLTSAFPPVKVYEPTPTTLEKNVHVKGIKWTFFLLQNKWQSCSSRVCVGVWVGLRARYSISECVCVCKERERALEEGRGRLLINSHVLSHTLSFTVHTITYLINTKNPTNHTSTSVLSTKHASTSLRLQWKDVTSSYILDNL